jgi:DNA-binding LytR/AlgR family response regulator
MIKPLIGFACAGVLFVAIANGQVSTVTGTESAGKITDYTPDSALVLDTGSGEPVHYKFAKKVTYVDKDGQAIQAPALTKNLRVKVHYLKQGGDLVVDKVTLTE